MATPGLDLSLLAKFTPAFIFLLSLVLIYALLSHTKPVGDQNFIYAIVALTISVIIILYPPLIKMITFMAPWFTILFIFIIFSLVMYKLFGATDSDFHGLIKGYGGLQWTLAIIAIIIALGAMSAAFGQDNLQGSTGGSTTGTVDNGDTITFQGDGSSYSSQGNTGGTGTTQFQTNLQRTFYHPKTLGVLFILVLASLTISMLSGKMTPSYGGNGGGGHH